MATRRQHFVEFFSPGTFYSETTARPVETRNVLNACQMAGEITERHGAKPYGFRFFTSIVADPIDDGEGGKLNVQPRQVDKSGMYFLGGDVLSYDDIVARNDQRDRILRSNMKYNRLWYMVENRNSYLSTHEFGEADVVVDPATGNVIERGDTKERRKYRKAKSAERDAELAKFRPETF